LHELLRGESRRMVIEENSINHLRDWHFHALASRQLDRTCRRDYPFGNGLLPGARFLKRLALPDLDA
jgi:hypothetical protein